MHNKDVTIITYNTLHRTQLTSNELIIKPEQPANACVIDVRAFWQIRFEFL